SSCSSPRSRSGRWSPICAPPRPIAATWSGHWAPSSAAPSATSSAACATVRWSTSSTSTTAPGAGRCSTSPTPRSPSVWRSSCSSRSAVAPPRERSPLRPLAERRLRVAFGLPQPDQDPLGDLVEGPPVGARRLGGDDGQAAIPCLPHCPPERDLAHERHAKLPPPPPPSPPPPHT